MKKLYVTNLAREVTGPELEQLFAAHGTVRDARIATDRYSGSSKGFGFVDMVSDQGAAAAIAALNGQEHHGRVLIVSEAKGEEGQRGGRSGRRGR